MKTAAVKSIALALEHCVTALELHRTMPASSIIPHNAQVHEICADLVVAMQGSAIVTQ